MVLFGSLLWLSTQTVTEPTANAAHVSRVAYIYNTNTAARDDFKSLLLARGYTVDTFTISETITANLSLDQVIIIGDDTGFGATWGFTDAVSAVSAAGKPIIGVGEGGYAFFGKMGLAIGYPNAGHNAGGTDAVAVTPADPIWTTPNAITLTSNLANLYINRTPFVEFPNPPITDVIRIGQDPNNQIYYPLVAQGSQGRCYLMWGFSDSPAGMTPSGKNLFINFVEAKPCDPIFNATPTHTPTNTHTPTPTQASGPCQEIFYPREIPSPGLIKFDDLPSGTAISAKYVVTYGVNFSGSPSLISNNPAKAHSSPNVAVNNASTATAQLVIDFSSDKTHVGFYMGNDPQQTMARMTAYDVSGQPLCTVTDPVPDPLTEFIGIYIPAGGIRRVTLDYGNTPSAEMIDDLYFAPFNPPTRTPVPTNTPKPTATPTAGPTHTPTPPLFVFPYHANLPILLPTPVPNSDLSIYGIEITQGIQCFDTTKGLNGCSDNSLPVVTKKAAMARIYLKHSGSGSSTNNVPVRLYIRANNVWYTANTTGKAKNTLSQDDADDSANVWFYVDFSNDVTVDFYARVDPNNTFAETDETNNRYPASAGNYITLNFRRHKTLDIVGQRLRYHPSGYGGNQYAGGWAVNGGAAQWLNQIMPLRDGGINYSVKSGYLNWTTSLGSGDGQHQLIGTLNSMWILENALAWLFGAGAFTGAEHVYGWAPSAGYSGGHADMPVYPHAGGLGVVGIGSDAPGTSVDNPGSGALIFGHELVHDYDVFHTDTGADDCGSNDSNSDFPYSTSSIQEFGFNPNTGKIYNPSNTHDLMSYCPSGGSKEGWIAPFTWNKLFNNSRLSRPVYARLGGTVNVLAGMFIQTGSSESLVVNVTISNTSPISGHLGALHKLPIDIANLPPNGPYAIQLRNGAQVLFTQPFGVNFTDEYTPTLMHPFADVSFIMPSVVTATSVVLLHNNNVLDTRNISANPPTVAFTNPSGPQTWGAGTTQTLSWTGSDTDGDTLTYSLLYSYDNGVTWQIIATSLTTTTFLVDVDSLAGGTDVRFRVVASDGFNMSYAETPAAINVPNKAPQATIASPVTNQFVLADSLLVMQGIGLDLEDGTLPGASLVWSSHRQGTLGIGANLPTNILATGQHTITLTVQDSLGQPASAAVSIFVGTSQVFLPLVIR
jgi:hypothetical protein